LDTLLPKYSRKFTTFENFRYFYEHKIVKTFDYAFCIAINERTLQNQKEAITTLSSHIMKCAGCGRLHFGNSSKQALQAHLESSPLASPPNGKKNRQYHLPTGLKHTHA
jgi:hypothetical protein